MDTKDLKNIADSENRQETVAIEEDAIEELESPTQTMQMTSSGTLPEVHDPKKYPEAPFAYDMTDNESVNLASGSLQYRVTDFVLPGKNGFDLAVTRIYGSEYAGLYDIHPQTYGNGRVQTVKRDNGHFPRTYGLGYGWSFALPSIEIVPERERLSGVTYSTHLHLEDGRSFVLDGSTLRDYPLQDVTVQNAAGTVTHPVTGATQSYHTGVSFKDGRQDFFLKVNDANGRLDRYTLVARIDRFGNMILFDMAEYGGMTVTDSWGRAITLSDDGGALAWTLPDKTTIRYSVNKDYPRQLAGVWDQNGRQTVYAYNNPDIYKAVSKFASAAYGDAADTAFEFLLLKAIVHPTGARTEYAYGIQASGNPEPLSLTLNSLGGYRRYFPLKSRKDVADGSEYNAVGYTCAPDSGSAFIATTTVAFSDGVQERHTFNDKGQLTAKEILHAGKKVFSGSYTYGADAAAANYKQLIAEQLRQHNKEDAGLYLEANKTYTYSADKKLDIAGVTETYPDAPHLDQGTSCTYGAFSQLTGKTCKKDADTTIAEWYDLTPDGKQIACRRVLENGALKEKTQFVYGESGAGRYCLLEERRFTCAENENLDGSADYVATKYAYDSGRFTHAPSVRRMDNLLDAEGNPAGGLYERFVYDAMGRLTRTVDAKGNATDVEYDALGRVTREVFPEIAGVRAEKRYRYDDRKNRIVLRDERGFFSRVDYTPLGQVQAEYLCTYQEAHSSDILLKALAYDSRQRLIRETAYDGRGNESEHIRLVSETTYDTFDRLLTKAIPATGYLETHRYDDVYADPAAAGRKWRRHGMTVCGEDGAPDVVTTEHSDQSGALRERYVDGVRTAQYEYDKLGNKIRQTDALGHIVETEYDHAGRVTLTRRFEGGKPLESRTVYDPLGNRVSSTDFMGNTTTFRYDGAGRLIEQRTPFDEAQTASVWYFYDAPGNLALQKTDTGAYVKETAYEYDARNRQTAAVLFEDEAKAKFSRTEYGYDAAGNKTALRTGLDETNASPAVTRTAYGRFGNVLSVTDALGQTERNEYDNTGRLVAKTDRNGSRTALEYDAAGRVTAQAVTAGGIETVKRTEYYRGGRKKREHVLETRAGKVLCDLSIAYEYNAKGQLMRQTDPGGAVKTFTYDANGSRIRFRLEKNALPELDLWYTYDETGRLAAVRKDAADGELLCEYSYDANGNRTRLTYPQNNIETLYRYNKANLVTALANKKGRATVSKFTYTYALDGNQLSKTDAAGCTVTYEYDRLGRLTKETDPKWSTISYIYDRFSNREHMEVTGPEKYRTNYTYDGNNRLVKEVKLSKDKQEIRHYQYDANGNQIRREQETLLRRTPQNARPQEVKFRKTGNGRDITLDTRLYNGLGQLIRVMRDGDETYFNYRPDGLRHSKQGKNPFLKLYTNTTHYWDGQNIVLETNGGGEVKARYFRGANLIAQAIGEMLYYYLFNAHGDVVQRVASSGESCPKYVYDAFGNQMPQTKTNRPDADPNPFRYCGEYYDAETNEVYLRARYYNPETGRFGSEDPIKDGENWYSYCNASPIMHVDPSGMIALWILIAIGIVLTSAISGGIDAGKAATKEENVRAAFWGGFAKTALTSTTLALLSPGPAMMVAGLTSVGNTIIQGRINDKEDAVIIEEIGKNLAWDLSAGFIGILFGAGLDRVIGSGIGRIVLDAWAEATSGTGFWVAELLGDAFKSEKDGMTTPTRPIRDETSLFSPFSDYAEPGNKSIIDDLLRIPSNKVTSSSTTPFTLPLADYSSPGGRSILDDLLRRPNSFDKSSNIFYSPPKSTGTSKSFGGIGRYTLMIK